MRREARRWFESSTARQIHHHVQLQCLRCARNLRKSSSPDKDTTLPRSRRGFESRLPLHNIRKAVCKRHQATCSLTAVRACTRDDIQHCHEKSGICPLLGASQYAKLSDGDGSAIGRALDCGSGGRGFESRPSPHSRLRGVTHLLHRLIWQDSGFWCRLSRFESSWSSQEY